MKYILLCLLFLTGCATKPVHPFIALHPDRVEQLNLESPTWTVANKTELQEITTNAQSDSIFYVLEPDQFKLLMDSLIQISDKMKKQDRIIQYYEHSIQSQGQVK